MDNQIVISSSSSSGPVDPDKPSPLLSLPDELLDIICGKVHVAKLSPICRRLYPFQQKRLYERITIRSYPALASLCATVHNSDFIGTLVISLQLGFVSWAAPNMTATDGRLCQTVSSDEFYDLIRRLSSLRTFTVKDIDTDLLDVFLWNTEAPLDLPRLDRLSFSTERVGGLDQGDWVRNLARSPRLTSLEIKLHAQNSPLPSMPSMPSPLPQLASLRVLELAGADLGGWVGPALAVIAPHVVDLRVREHRAPPAYERILRQAPTGLRRLTLCSPLANVSAARPGVLLDQVLPRFGRLQHLTLSQHSFTPSHLAPYLASLASLRVLGFGWASSPTDDLLLDLLKGPHRLQHLRGLELNHVEGIRGPSINESAPVPLDAETAVKQFEFAWSAPVWPVGCTEDGLEAALAAASDAGVEVTGSAVGAVGWDEAYQQERHKRQRVWLRHGRDVILIYQVTSGY
ncbi:uncharacterized protein RHOBADRAFT_56149 [Rhodotorula graminis WP1]|uniref:F-box domain-containing protein n=1 Tax=Rhodotorula graminis (strain WP1) TaxID=578459 RepID=A0A0P9IRI6_RHOGW|nr:uncharacterized protein RHOBADRAFT_56149 [Rhodotorula graminis WP1]KPV72012.1 hypothetical protein RHOBADRAFT_56149 [Rhodotorula graminis WP1]